MEDFLNIVWFVITTMIFLVLQSNGYNLIDIIAFKYGWQGKIMGIFIVGVVFKIYFYVFERG